MSTALAERPVDATAIEHALVGGDWSRLTTEQRISYYNRVCESLGLNPLTKPFAYILLNGKLTLYALKDCTEQLRSSRQISIQIKAREVVEGCYVVTASAHTSQRQDESIGAVPIDGLKGENRANAMMKAETKAKRRVTLSICGLGMLDESEVASIDPHTYSVTSPPPATTKDVAPREIASGPNAGASAINTQTGEEIPAGYHLISEYTYNAPWHELVVNGLDCQGGAVKLSTKLAAGDTARQAFYDQKPVRLDWKPKGPKNPGEGYLNRVYLLPELPEIQLRGDEHAGAINDSDIPF